MSELWQLAATWLNSVGVLPSDDPSLQPDGRVYELAMALQVCFECQVSVFCASGVALFFFLFVFCMFVCFLPYLRLSQTHMSAFNCTSTHTHTHARTRTHICTHWTSLSRSLALSPFHAWTTLGAGWHGAVQAGKQADPRQHHKLCRAAGKAVSQDAKHKPLSGGVPEEVSHEGERAVYC